MNNSNLLIDVEAILAEAMHPKLQDYCIYRVPYDIREVNIDAYTPKFISIGPLHHYDQRLQNMEKYKQVYFKQFVGQAKIKLEDLISSIKEDEPRLRRCYSENLEISTDELIKVILVDACFIVALFYKKYYNKWTNDDYTLLKPRSISSISLDLLLLENQIPFFIVEKLYNLAVGSHQDGNSPSFLKLSIRFFDCFNKQKLEPNFTISHFTDLLRTFHLQEPKPDRKESYRKHIPSASAFREAGVKFRTNESKCILDLQFSRGCLKVPCIEVDDNIEILPRNMVALEQCHYPYDGYIGDYVSVMDFLINTGKDVEVLVKNVILLNWLGDNDDVAKLFNNLCKNVEESDFNSQYIDLFEELNVFYKNGWRQMKATLKRDYCSTPWRTLATCAAIVIVFLTLIQTVCSILQVV